MLLLLTGAQGIGPSIDPVGVTDRLGARFFVDASPIVYRGGSHRRFARVILSILALLFLHP